MATFKIRNGAGEWVPVPISGSGGASSWDDLSDKPFYSEVTDMPGLPKTYWNNYSPVFQGNTLDTLDISDEEFKQYTGKNKSECYAYSTLILNLEQLKSLYPMMSGQPLPTEEEIIEQYGSWDNWAKTLASELGGYAIYDNTWNYVIEEVPDLSKYFDVSKEFKINNIIKDTNPIVYHGYIDMDGDYMTYYLDLNIIGNTSILNGLGSELGEVGYLIQEAGISNITNDEFLIEYGNLTMSAEGQTCSYGLITFITTDLSLVNKYTNTTPTTFTPKAVDEEFSVTVAEETIEGTDTKILVGTYSSHNSDGRNLVSVIKLHAPDDIECSAMQFSCYSASSRYYDLDMKILLDGNVLWAKTGYDEPEDLDYINLNLPLTAGDHYFIVQYKFGSYSSSTLGSGGNFEFFLKGMVEGDYGQVGVKPEGAEITWELVTDPVTVDVISYTYDSPINYVVTAAKEEQIHYLDDKYIEKPEWWFGEKEYYNATPIVFMKNVPGEIGGL